MENNTPGTKTWQKSSAPGLYQHLPSGTYYSRYSVRGVRKLQSLGTAVLTIAKLKHAKRLVGVEKARASTAVVSTARTMGDMARIAHESLGASSQGEATKKNYRQQLEVLRANWPGFDNLQPSSIGPEHLHQLRERLRTAHWVGHLGKREKDGYSNAYINQVLARLNNLLQLARERHLSTDDPFATRPGLNGSVWLPVRSRAPELPTRTDMERIFAEMARVTRHPNESAALFKCRQAWAIEASEHTRFMAFSGARLAEANSAEIGDDLGNRFRIRGTKSKTSFRVIPVVPAFRALLDEIKVRRGQFTGRWLVPHTSRDALGKACARLGLPKLRHHDLRHLFATICVESGIDIPTVSRWLGHSDGGALAMRVYGHLRDEHSVAAAAKVTFSPTAARSIGG